MFQCYLWVWVPKNKWRKTFLFRLRSIIMNGNLNDTRKTNQMPMIFDAMNSNRITIWYNHVQFEIEFSMCVCFSLFATTQRGKKPNSISILSSIWQNSRCQFHIQYVQMSILHTKPAFFTIKILTKAFENYVVNFHWIFLYAFRYLSLNVHVLCHISIGVCVFFFVHWFNFISRDSKIWQKKELFFGIEAKSMARAKITNTLLQ